MRMEIHPDPANMVLHLQRFIQGKLHHCPTVVVKGTGLVVSENCRPVDSVPGVADPKQVLADRATEEDARRMKLFIDEVPCWFSGCEEMRRSYAADLERLPPDCPGCEIGKIMRRYLDRMAELGV